MSNRIDLWRVRELLRHRDFVGLCVLASIGGGWFTKRGRHE